MTYLLVVCILAVVLAPFCLLAAGAVWLIGLRVAARIVGVQVAPRH
jgi:hypothetical protein